MNYNLKAFALGLCALAGGFTAQAEESTGKLALEFHTTIYETYGNTNTFSLVFGSTDAGVGTYLDVDCGHGEDYMDEYQLVKAGYDTENEESTGTYITCNVTSDGIVKIYCDDPSVIDWIDASGCYIDRITFGDELKNLVYLSLNHNELKALDLSCMSNLQMLYLSDNAYSTTPLEIGSQPLLTILEINNIGAISSTFDICNYPSLTTLDAWNAQGLTKLTPSGCPDLIKLSIDGTDVSSLDVTQNLNLQLLNISDTRIQEIDLSKNTELTQLYCTHESSVNSEYKIKKLDLSNNSMLYYLFCTGNDLTELDVTKNPLLGSLTARKNLLTKIDVSENDGLLCLNISDNYIGYADLPWPTTSTDEGDVDLYTEYDYAQRNFPVDKSYPVGAVLDFSEKMLRDKTDTEAVLYAIDESDPTNPVTVPASCYDYDMTTGRLTLNEVYADSVYVSFKNSKFSAANLRTEMFKIKSAEDYGKPTLVASMAFGVYGGTVSFSVGIDGATAEEPKRFFVDFGSGQVECKATNDDASEVNVSGVTSSGSVRIYTEDGVEISALDVRDVTLYSCNVDQLRSMRSLALVNTGLYSIDLQWNRCLRKLDLSHNNMTSFTLVGNNQGYGKNALTDVNLSYNKISSFTWNENFTVQHFDISHNALSELNLSDNTTITDLNIGYNEFTEFSCSDCTALTDLNVEGNQLSSLTLPDGVVLNTLNVSNNNFTLATLPATSKVSSNYTYAPQNKISIPTKAPGVNLAAQNVNDHTTYTWKYAENDFNVPAVYFSSTVTGQFTFVRRYVGENVYCEMTNTDFPAFTGENALRTTVIETADMPSNKVCEFTIAAKTDDDDSEINYNTRLTLTSATAGNTLYIDWNGDGTLSQYTLATSYQNFYPEVTEGAKVSVYSYDDEDNISVFSMANIKLEDFKLGSEKSFNKLINFSLVNAGLSEIDYPKADGLRELILQGNKLTDIDVTRYPELTYLNLADNQLADADFSNLSKVQLLFIGANGLTSLKLGKNDVLHTLYAEANELTSVDFSNLSNLQEVHVNSNKLTDINVANNERLVVLDANDNELDKIEVNSTNNPNLGVLEISGNRFKFSTLPLESDVFGSKTSYTYEYSKQATLEIEAVDGVVDLGSEAVVNGTATNYVWCLGEPDYDDYGTLVNEILESQADNEEDPEYIIENGVTSFQYDFSSSEKALYCVLTNDLFPNLTLETTMIKPVSAGVENIAVDNNASRANDIYNLQGIRLKANATADDIKALTPGVYIIGGQKVIVK